MRLDKFLVEMGIGSRKEVKQLIKKGFVCVNHKMEKESNRKINEFADCITFAGQVLQYQEYYYYMLHKPQGVISATEDRKEKTVIDLLSEEDYRKDLFPVGRLDKDTEGLLFVTNDGPLAHQLLSPKKHVDKEYEAIIAGIVTKEDQELFAEGSILTNGERVKPSVLLIDAVDEEHEKSSIRLIIQEGKFHQVKRMFDAIGKKVRYLKRLRMGKLELDGKLPLGSYRSLTPKEVEQLRSGKQ